MVFVRYKIDHHTQRSILLHFGNRCQEHAPSPPDLPSYLISNYDLPCLLRGVLDISHLLQDTLQSWAGSHWSSFFATNLEWEKASCSISIFRQ